MRKMKEVVTVLLVATRYSFAFCWRNSKGWTIARLANGLVVTVLGYLATYTLGKIINAVQTIISSGKTNDVQRITSFVSSEAKWPIICFGAVSVFTIVAGRLNWFFRNQWSFILRYANQRELNLFRSSLDAARFKSKGYDDLDRRIKELNQGWYTRVSYAEEMLGLFTLGASFLLFGASLCWHKPAYAVSLLVTSIPYVISEFKLVTLWWNTSQEMVPTHKKRSELERAFNNNHAFVQALMFNQMPALHVKVAENVNLVLKRFDEIRRMSINAELISRTIAAIGLAGVIVHAAWNTVITAGEIGTLTIVIAWIRTFQGNLEQIVYSLAEQWNAAKGVVLIEKDFFGQKPLITTQNPVKLPRGIIPEIRFNNVSFRYPDTETDVIKGVSFCIKPRERLAIVGASGNGKSTLQALLMRQYDPTEGTIFIDGTDLRNIEPAHWANYITALAQDFIVLNRLMGEEIASSRLDEPIDMDKVREVSYQSHFDVVAADDPRGYEMQLGTEFGGKQLSGGENQRLALARTLYRRSPIIIFDEPDAKLDPESANRVIENIFAMTGVTIIMITHHVSRAHQCDRVIVLGKGKVVEEGTPAELMDLDGKYAQMYRADQKRSGNTVVA